MYHFIFIIGFAYLPLTFSATLCTLVILGTAYDITLHHMYLSLLYLGVKVGQLPYTFRISWLVAAVYT